MAKYYFIGTLLSPLSFDAPPEISFEDFDTLLRDHLTVKDYEKTLVIRRFYDILNVRALWLEEDFDRRGRLGPTELSEALMNQEGLPSYVYEFIDRYSNQDDR